MIMRSRDVGENQVWDVGDDGKNVWDVGFSYNGTCGRRHSTLRKKTVTESESLALKMGKIVKDDTGSGRWEVG